MWVSQKSVSSSSPWRLPALDARSLALFRVVLGTIIAGDLLRRSDNLASHYTDDGILPRAVLGGMSPPTHWSLHLAAGGAQWEIFLFAVQFIFALLLTAGLFSRVAAVGSWILLVSLQNRNPYVLNVGDSILRQELFWAMFLPVSACWSVDALIKRRKAETSTAVVALGTTLHWMSIYLIAVLQKTDRTWWRDGSAVQLALHLRNYVSPLGAALGELSQTCQLLTYATLALELLGPLLLLSKSERARTCAVALFVLFHFGLAATLNIYSISAVAICGWLMFLPPSVWHGAGAPRLTNSDRARRRLIPYLALAPVLLQLCYVRLMQDPASNTWLARSVTSFAQILRLDQQWKMFAPGPFRVNFRLVVVAPRNNGELFDLLDGQKLNFDSQALVQRPGFWDNRWEMFATKVFLSSDRALAAGFLRYACTHVATSEYGLDQMFSAELGFIFQWVMEGGVVTNPGKVTIWSERCRVLD